MANGPTYQQRPTSMASQLFQGWKMKICLGWVGLMVLCAIGANIIANERPLYAKVKGKTYFPAFHLDPAMLEDLQKPGSQVLASMVKWRELPYESVVWPLIPYSPNTQVGIVGNQSPFGTQYDRAGSPLSMRFRHWLGTTGDNRDVAAEIVHGARTSLVVGLGTIFLVALIGIFVGAISGYFGNNRLVLSRAKRLLILPTLFLLYFYGWYVHRPGFWDLRGLSDFLVQFFLMALCSALVIFGYLGLSKLMAKSPYFQRKSAFQLDLWISKGMEIIESLPTLLLLITVASLFNHPPLYVTILIIGLTGWTGIARLVRGECLRISQLAYIDSGRAMGFSNGYLIWRHVLPNALPHIGVALTLGIGNIIITEAALSFLDIGIPKDTPSWGRLLAQAQFNLNLWWAALFPGCFIFGTVLSFNLLAERLRDIIDPRDHS